MQKLFRQILTEALWLILALAFTILFFSLLFGWSYSQNTIDIYLKDTAFVINRWHVLFPLFCLVTFLLFLMKELRNLFRRTLSNWILIIIGVALIISLTFLIKSLSQNFIDGGWTLYPPLSALGPDKVPELTQDPVARFITNILTIIQGVILIMLLFITYRWGTQKRSSITE